MTKKQAQYNDSNPEGNSSANPRSHPDQNWYGDPGTKQYYHHYPYRKLYRSTRDRWLGGVCGGLAEYYNTDPVLVRLLWVILTLITVGGGIIAYILFLIFVKKAPSNYTLTNQYTTTDQYGRTHQHYQYKISE